MITKKSIGYEIKNNCLFIMVFLGIFSAHRFYLRRNKSALIYLFTLQLFGIGWLIDLFVLGRAVDEYNFEHGNVGMDGKPRDPRISMMQAVPHKYRT
jgi:TM2 domain-containing membrane protein YozV